MNHMTKNKIAGEETRENTLTRKEALAKAGKYALFTAAGSMLLLSPKKAVAASDLPGDPSWGTDNQQEFRVPSSGGSRTNQEPPSGKKDLA